MSQRTASLRFASLGSKIRGYLVQRVRVRGFRDKERRRSSGQGSFGTSKTSIPSTKHMNPIIQGFILLYPSTFEYLFWCSCERRSGAGRGRERERGRGWIGGVFRRILGIASVVVSALGVGHLLLCCVTDVVELRELLRMHMHTQKETRKRSVTTLAKLQCSLFRVEG